MPCGKGQHDKKRHSAGAAMLGHVWKLRGWGSGFRVSGQVVGVQGQRKIRF